LQKQDSNNQALRTLNLVAGTTMMRPEETSLPRLFNFTYFRVNKFKISDIKKKKKIICMIFKLTHSSNYLKKLMSLLQRHCKINLQLRASSNFRATLKESAPYIAPLFGYRSSWRYARIRGEDKSKYW
jgi:hypothetical protein